MSELLVRARVGNMDLIPGFLALLVVMVVAVYSRGFILRSRIKNSRVIYKDLRVYSSAGSSPGVMVYAISIATVIIGPVSFKLFLLNEITYVFLNVVAAIFFAAFYPPFSPVTNFATIDVIERNGKRYCIVGRVMNRKYKLVMINESPRFEITAETIRHRLIFEVRNQSDSRT